MDKPSFRWKTWWLNNLSINMLGAGCRTTNVACSSDVVIFKCYHSLLDLASKVDAMKLGFVDNIFACGTIPSQNVIDALRSGKFKDNSDGISKTHG